MTYICYQPKNFRDSTLKIIFMAKRICEAFAAKGYDLTLRQLYYQFIARDVFPNSEKSYKNLGNIISDARLAGLISWDMIRDRHRQVKQYPQWSSPQEAMLAICQQYRINIWADQPWYVEVWVEKDAQIGIVSRAANKFQVPYMACKGYVSQSEMWGAATSRFIAKMGAPEWPEKDQMEDEGEEYGIQLDNYLQEFKSSLRRCGGKMNEMDMGEGYKAGMIIHLGDHDPSGIDMTRDIRDRMHTFGCPVIVERIALNIEQVRQYNPPPNWAKVSDCRAKDYIKKFGPHSWELDALSPEVVDELITQKIESLIDREKFNAKLELAAKEKAALNFVRENFDKVKDIKNEQ